MSTFYDRLLATANRLIRDKGKTAYVITPGAETGPPHNPTIGPSTRTECKWVETGYSLTNRDGSLVQVGDKMGIVEASGTPELTDTFEDGGIEYQFVDVQPLNPGGTVMLYEIQARL